MSKKGRGGFPILLRNVIAIILISRGLSAFAQIPGGDPLAVAAPSAAGDQDGQWPMPAKNYASTRYCNLEEINTGSVVNLRVAWMFSTRVARWHAAAPIVAGSVLYVVTPYPNVLYALDLANAGAVLWKYEPKPTPAAQGVAGREAVNRGCAYSNGRIFMNTPDGNCIAVDAKTGKEIWKTPLADINKGETVTMAPFVVRNKVLVGNSGGEFGVRGWLTALDARDGKIVWKAWSTGADQDVLIHAGFHPFYKRDQGEDLGVATWPPDQWLIGGGTASGWISYDPELNLIFYGTGNPGVWNPDVRPGENKWSCTVFARDPDTGEARWAYQIDPHDLFAWDGAVESLLLDLTLKGRTRKTLLRADRDGYVYVMDRATGEVISATQFARNTTTTGVNLKTGELDHIAKKTPQLRKIIRDIAPATAGAKGWQPCAFSPRTGLVYIPHQEMSMDFEAIEANYIQGTPYLGANVKMYAGPDGNCGEFCAWDPIGAKKIWALKERFPVWCGALATAGDLVFYGTMEGWFKAVNARNGELLWKFKCNSVIGGQPV